MMKKRIFTVLLCLALIAGMISAAAMTASAEEHTHTPVYVTKKLPTCTKEGNEAYFYCPCGKWFSDFECTKEITDHDSILSPKLAHAPSDWITDETGHSNVCTICNKVVTEKSPHVFGDWTVTKEATETEKGSQSRTCTVCFYTETEEIPEKAPEHTHSYVTKYDDGSHWSECSCGDMQNAEEHQMTEDGHCAVCGYGCPHTETELRNAKKATCSEAGYTGDKCCVLCGKRLHEGSPLPMKAHDPDESGVCRKCGAEVGTETSDADETAAETGTEPQNTETEAKDTAAETEKPGFRITVGSPVTLVLVILIFVVAVTLLVVVIVRNKKH